MFQDTLGVTDDLCQYETLFMQNGGIWIQMPWLEWGGVEWRNNGEGGEDKEIGD